MTYLDAAQSGFRVLWGVDLTTRFGTLGALFGVFLNILIGVGFTIAIGSIAWSGIQYVTSFANPKAHERAWRTFIWGVVAAIIVIIALSVKAAVAGVFNVSNVNIVDELPTF